jgi:uncharacterized membrane protein
VNPFDLKAALLARHAQHVVLIHFPIALFLISCFFDFLARWKRNPNLASAAYYNLVAAAVSALPAVATGLLAWQWQLEGKRLTGTLRLHLLSGLLSTGMIWLLCWWRGRLRKTTDQPMRSYVAIELIAILAVSFTGHLGGILSGVEAPG